MFRCASNKQAYRMLLVRQYGTDPQLPQHSVNHRKLRTSLELSEPSRLV